MRLNPLLKRLATYPQEALNQKKAQVRAAGMTLFDFGTGDPREPTPAFIRQALRDAVPEISQYPGVRGPPELQTAIIDYLLRRYGLELDAETQILPTSGAKEAVFHLPMVFIDPAAPDRTVIFPDPGYAVYQRGTLFAGGEAHAQVLEGGWRHEPWKTPVELMQRSRVMWINSPHNPSGAVLTLDELERTWAHCREHGVLLVNDECYADIYDLEPPPSLLQVSTDGVLVLHSLSKRSGMTGYRSGFMAGCPLAISAYRTFRSNPGVVPQDFVSHAAAAAWADDGHAQERRDVLRAKKQVFRELFAELGLEIVASQATLYIWVRSPDGVADEDYALALLDKGIVISPGSYFGLTGSGAGYVRLAMVPSVEGCLEAAALWRELHQEKGWHR